MFSLSFGLEQAQLSAAELLYHIYVREQDSFGGLLSGEPLGEDTSMAEGPGLLIAKEHDVLSGGTSHDSLQVENEREGSRVELPAITDDVVGCGQNAVFIGFHDCVPVRDSLNKLPVRDKSFRGAVGNLHEKVFFAVEKGGGVVGGVEFHFFESK